MTKLFKSLGILLSSMLLLSSVAFATDAGLTKEQLLDEFQKDAKFDISTLSSDTAISDDQVATIDGIVKLINGEASNEAYYDKAAELFAKAKDQNIKVFVGGNLINFSNYDNVQPVMKENRTLVPLRALAEALGGTIDWDGTKNLVTLTLSEKIIKLTLNSATAYVNDLPVNLDVPAQAVSDRTMIPLRFVSENFEKQVDFHAFSGGPGVVSIIDK